MKKNIFKLLTTFVVIISILILFIPSVFIYYNESALIHSVWYLVISSIGLLVGTIIYKIIHRK